MGLSTSRAFRNTDLYYQSIAPPHGMIFCDDELVGLDVNPQAYSEAHFATFPEKLVEPLILAGTSEKGCCPECGAPWVRVVERGDVASGYTPGYTPAFQTRRFASATPGFTRDIRTTGWRPTCECGEGLRNRKRSCAFRVPRPAIVLDPFAGSGTVGAVATRLGRRSVLIELNPEYVPLIERRIAKVSMRKLDAPADKTPLFAAGIAKPQAEHI